MNRVRATLALTICCALPASADEPTWTLKASALAAEPVAVAAARSARVSIEPGLKWNVSGVELRARERLRRLQMNGERRTDADLRELTAAWRSNDTGFTVGAQQLNWGRMDILRVTDLINPVDQHDLFIEELPEAKLAVWMANLEWQRGAQTFQLIYTPQVALDRLPSHLAGFPVHVSKPGTSLKNSTLAVRYGVEALGWNADFIAARGWQTSPALVPVVGALGPQLQGVVSRQDSLGFSADKPLGDTLLRVEGLVARLSPDRRAAGLGAVSGHQSTLGAGVDVRAGAWFFAAQAVAQWSRPVVEASSHTVFVSAIAQRKFMQDRLATRALHIRDQRSGSSWTSLQGAFELSAHHVLQVQADWIQGNSMQAFGSFSDRSRIAASVRAQF